MLSSSKRRILRGVDFGGVAPRCLPLRELNLKQHAGQELGAELTVADAELAAARMIKQAEEQAALIREKAYREGFEQGFREGQARAEEATREMLAGAQEALHAAEAERVAIFNQLEREVVELAQEIAERVVAAELKVNPEVVLAVAREAFTLVRDRPYVILLVNPDDLPVCQQARQQFEALLAEGAVLRILPDPQVNRGGCLVDTGKGMVDATLSSRLATLLETLKG
ncbi:MAG: FliH/SctL family protein [Bacillota bacterium]|nr:FliH/SctL family protein [Thermoanaerobacteraceae bacterium]